jgi:hypothetical protein
MDENGATRGISRDLRASQIEGFLREALGDGKLSVAALEERARAAGLVDERQSITDFKPFKWAKRSMGIRWLWPRRRLVLDSPNPGLADPGARRDHARDIGPVDRAKVTAIA